MLTERAPASGGWCRPASASCANCSIAEDAASGELLLPSCTPNIPDERLRQIAATAPSWATSRTAFPFAGGTPRGLHRRAAAGGPHLATVARGDRHGGCALAGRGRQRAAALDGREAVGAHPPTADADVAIDALERLTADPPYGVRDGEAGSAEAGWHAPPELPWLARAIDRASTATFGQAPRSWGGGTIPFMGMLGRQFPQAQFVITGVLGPESNAHGPNEFLHLPTVRRVTAAVAHILDAHARR